MQNLSFLIVYMTVVTVVLLLIVFVGMVIIKTTRQDYISKFLYQSRNISHRNIWFKSIVELSPFLFVLSIVR